MVSPIACSLPAHGPALVAGRPGLWPVSSSVPADPRREVFVRYPIARARRITQPLDRTQRESGRIQLSAEPPIPGNRHKHGLGNPVVTDVDVGCPLALLPTSADQTSKQSGRLAGRVHILRFIHAVTVAFM